MKTILAVLIFGCAALNAQITNGLIAHYTFDNHTNDVSGNNNHGVNNGAMPVTDRLGQPNMAYYFDGFSNDVFVPNSVSLNPVNAISICGWYKTASFSGAGYSPIFTKGFTSHSAPTYQYKLGVTGDLYGGSASGRFGFSITTTNNILHSVFTPNNYWMPHTWYFIVGTYDGSQIRLYVDNQLIASQAVSGQMANYPTNVKIGNNTTISDLLKGTLDDVKVYDRALNDNEIKTLYNATRPVSDFMVSATGTVCVGATVVLTDQSTKNPVSWTWGVSPAGALLSNATSSNPSVTFSSPGVYSISLQANTLNEQGTVSTKTIYVGPLPVITSPNASQSVCVGNTVTFNASGAATYTWSNNGGSQAQVTYTPAASSTYTVTGDLNGCISNKEVSVTVMPLPAVSIQGEMIMCMGSDLLLQAIGANTYTWSNSTVGPFTVVTPTVSTTYSVAGTSVNGCINSASFNVEVVICSGLEQLSTPNAFYLAFPNPAVDQLTIRATDHTRLVKLQLFDVTGKLLLEKELDFRSSDTTGLDISDLSKGMYLVKLISGTSSQTLRMIKE